MKKKRFSLVGVALAALLLFVLAFFARLAMHRPPAVELPEPGGTESGAGVIADASQETVRRVEVTPETVQRVIERLSRPASYSRTLTVERFWADGSGASSVSVYAAGGWTRVDVSEEGAEARHVITGDGRSWIWYGSEDRVFSGAAVLSADEEQSIPTYENILALPTEAIAVADYRAYEGVNCIYVETASDASGYAERFWVGVESGLLVAAERVSGGSVVYRMSGLEVETAESAEDAFRLPDGETLYDPQGAQQG